MTVYKQMKQVYFYITKIQFEPRNCKTSAILMKFKLSS